jgi:hypothetical protein
VLNQASHHEEVTCAYLKIIPWRRIVGAEVWLHALITSALNGDECSTSRPDRGKNPRYPFG